MDEKTLAEFIKKAKKDDYKIGSVTCPAFGGKQVHFDCRGFDHSIITDNHTIPFLWLCLC